MIYYLYMFVCIIVSLDIGRESRCVVSYDKGAEIHYGIRQ